MEKDFWIERWERQEIGFHQGEINPLLLQCWSGMPPSPGSRVFVPLCGKSRDMLWLREQGCEVLGVELSAIAVQAFFAENGLESRQVRGDRFDSSEADGIRILRGDFFDLARDDLAGATTVYDRASLVALPPAMRERYARHLVRILPSGAHVLLITFDYPPSEMSGPPFSIAEDEVAALYGACAEVRLLAREDVLPRHPRLREHGLSRLHECAFLLTLK